MAYVIFVSLNIAGTEMSFRFTIAITVLALGILAVFWIGAIPHVDFARYALSIEAAPGETAFLPRGVSGILAALPFAVWFYLAIEELPLAAEEAHAPERDMPKGITAALLTLVIAAFLTLVLNSSIAPGAWAVSRSEEPLFLAFRTIFGEEGIGSRALAAIAVAGLVASFHTIIFAYGRQIYSLSRPVISRRC